MNDRICNLCGGEGFEIIRRINDGVSIARCLGCGMARTYPYPDFNFKEQEKYCKFYLDNEAMFRTFARAMMKEILNYKNEGAILDIGCAVGYLLDEAKRGGFGETCGIELNLEAAGVSRGKAHAVYTGPLEDLGIAPERFDVIVFNHVLEHIPDMRKFLSNVGRVLKKDGIVYCGMPNYDSLMQKWLKEKWYGWGMPDHVWHFTPSTFRAVMETGGFAPKKMVKNAMHYPYSKSLRKNTRAAVAGIADRLGLGDQIYGVFQKRQAC